MEMEEVNEWSMKESLWNFSLDVLKLLLRSEDGNVFASPASLMSSLAMTAAGARGTTLDEILAALHLPSASPATHAAVGAFLHSLLSASAASMTSANRLFIDRSLPVSRDFADTLQRSYRAACAQLDFRASPEASVAAVNAWVAAETQGRIGGLLPALSGATSLVLVNAVHLRGRWETAFDRALTRPRAFHAPAGARDLPMMELRHARLPYNYSGGADADCVALAMQSGLALLLVVPRRRDGLAAAEKELCARPELLRHLVAEAEAEVGAVVLPRCRLRFQADLTPRLAELGMRQLCAGGDLSGISSGNPSVSQFLHKTFLEVTEEGVEAAAASALVATLAVDLRPKTVSVIADRPFLVIVTAGDSPLFVGRVSCPEPIPE